MESMNVMEELAKLLTCSLCGGILRDAHTINECLHDFCLSCIQAHFESKSKFRDQCPNCSLTLGGKPKEKLVRNNQLNSLIDEYAFPCYSAAEK